MSLTDATHEIPVRYLSRADVVAASSGLDAVQIVRRVLELRAKGRTTLPEEAYMGWTTRSGDPARCLALPGALWGEREAIGLKVINSSLGNPDHGIPRAQGLTFLFDRETARPIAVMEAAYISALRTAAYTALSIELLAAGNSDIAVIGCGTLGEFHVRLLAERESSSRFLLFDIDRRRSDRLAAELKDDGIAVGVAPSAQFAIQQSDVVITATTVTAGYVEFGWLRAGALIAHVSLDDVLPEVVRRADLLIVDDWNLVRNDTHRLLGRMYRAGDLADPSDGSSLPTTGRQVDATLTDIVAGLHRGRENNQDIILSNPFGMGILDIAIAAEVQDLASRAGLGIDLPA